jgi:hypothetical protein
MNKLLCMVLTMWMLAASSLRAEDFGKLIFNHQIAIGMTFANVEAAWGRPAKVDRSVTSSGVTEYWFFNKNTNNTMVVFENGRVSSFHQF